MSVYLRQLELGPMQNFVYLVGSTETRQCLVIDPAWEIERAMAQAESDGMRLVGALVTHTHRDHVNAADRIEGPLHVHAREADRLRASGDVAPSASGDVIELGPDCRVTCIHTPGHTPGSQCFLVGDSLFSGDTLFIDGCGRCDLPGGDPEALYRSLTGTLAALPPETRLFPGHNYADRPVSTLAAERSHNPYYQFHDLHSFIAYRMGGRS